MPAPASKYRFDPYEVRVRTRELCKHGIKLKLRPQSFQILQILLERAPDVVTREELRQKLWSSETFVDFEHGLNTAIRELRSALSDSASEPRYIETLPKLGYRIIVSVEMEAAEAVAVGQVVSMPTGQRAGTGSDRTEQSSHPTVLPVDFARPIPRRSWPIVVAASLLLLMMMGGYWRWQQSRVRPQVPASRLMLAVLPFENLTGDAAQDYFSDGLTEEMISQLGRLDPQRIGLIARTSVMHYKHSQAPLEQIGRELGVRYVLEGSVRRDSNHVRISAQLIQLKDQTHLWSREYDRQLSSLLALQSEIAQQVADEIQLTLAEKRNPIVAKPSSNLSATAVEAYDLYLRGRYFWNKRNKEGFEQAADSFQQAIARDPNYAPAYAGLADTYALMGNAGRGNRPDAIMPRARAAALKALQIDPGLAEAHTSLALITENYDFDWRTAEKEYRRAIELNPNYATAHHWYAECLMWLGRFDEALQESERARQLDPLSLIIAADHGAIFYYSRQYDRAIEQLGTVLAMDPNFGRANLIYAAYLHRGQLAEALAKSDRDLRHCSSDPWICGWLAYVYAVAGQPAQARPALLELERLDRTQHIPAEPLMAVYIGMGRTDEGFRYLEKAYSERSTALSGLKIDPLYDPVRNDPRFQDLLRRVNLEQ